MNTQPFRDQVVIVTGASAGIGQALARMLASQGTKVVVAARRAERLEQLADECRANGGEMLIIPTDVRDEDQCKELIEKTVNSYGQIDTLINNAGIAASAMLDDFPDLLLFKQVVDVNFYGAVNCTYYALPYLKQSRGRIVTVSSIGGKAAMPYNTPYVASKYAMNGFYDALRMELKQHAVSVTVICPWWVVTEFHEAQMDKDGIPRGKKGRAIYTKKMMTAERCAQIILNSANRRRREVLMGPGWLAVWLKILSPRMLDWLTIKVFLEPVIRRAREAQKEMRV
ncbi:MAG: SDR family oxidoreductase [Chloroflexi bacterium]|nr:MAG: SDR family oxidoreductase [Chloroflexota bacterium]